MDVTHETKRDRLSAFAWMAVGGTSLLIAFQTGVYVGDARGRIAAVDEDARVVASRAR